MSNFTENYLFAKKFQNEAIAKKWFHGGCKEDGSNQVDLMAERLQDNSYQHFDLNSDTFQNEVKDFFSKKISHA